MGLDAKDGDVAINGWEKMTGHNVIDLAQKFEDYGVESIIYTDIGRDGMLAGVNIDATVKLSAGSKNTRCSEWWSFKFRRHKSSLRSSQYWHTWGDNRNRYIQRYFKF